MLSCSNRFAVLPGQASRGDGLQALPGDSHQGELISPSRSGVLLTRDLLAQAGHNKATKNEQDLKEFEDALEEHRAKGSEDQEMARKVQKSKKKATKTKARRTLLFTCFCPVSALTVALVVPVNS